MKHFMKKKTYNNHPDSIMTNFTFDIKVNFAENTSVLLLKINLTICVQDFYL